MGFDLGGIGKSIGGAFKSAISSVAGPALQKILPAATDILKNIMGSGMDKLKGAASKLVEGLHLPNVLNGLAQSLLGKGSDLLKQLGGGLLDKGMGALFGKLQEFLGQNGGVAPTTVPGAPAGTPAVNVPQINGSAAGTADRASGAQQAQAVTQQAVSAAGGRDVDSQLESMIGALKEPAFPGTGASEQDLQKYNIEAQKFSRMMNLISQIAAQRHDSKKQIIGNIR